MPDVAIISDRIRERVTADFGPAAFRVVTRLEQLEVEPQVDPERVHGAVLISARGSASVLDDAIEHAREDWRDLLDRAGLADDDWRDVVDARLGPA